MKGVVISVNPEEMEDPDDSEHPKGNKARQKEKRQNGT